MSRPLVAFAFVLILAAPSALTAVPPGASEPTLPRLAPWSLLTLVADQLAPLDQGALRKALGPVTRVGALAPAPADEQGAMPIQVASHEVAGEWIWMNNTLVTLDEPRVPWRGGLVIQNSTVTIEGPLFVPPGSTLIITDSTLRAASPPDFMGAGGASLYAQGNLTATRATFQWLDGYLERGAEGDAIDITASRFMGSQSGFRASGASTHLSGNLFYNSTGTALTLGENAIATGNTFVNNGVGAAVWGANATLTGNTFRFNILGVRYEGGANVTITGNDIADNYQDGLYGTSTSDAVDASGNWWDGTPNVDGDSWGGTGVTVSSSQPTRQAAPDRVADLPFALHSSRGDATWSFGSVLDGPVIARAGTLRMQGVTVDANGFLIGSQASGALDVRQSSITNTARVFSRGQDSFDGLTVTVAPGKVGDGILSVSNSPVIRNSVFVGTTTGVLHTARSLNEPPVPITVESCRFERNGIAFITLVARPTFRGNIVNDSIAGAVTALTQSARVEDNVFRRTGIGLLTVLDQAYTASRNGAYDGVIGLANAVTATSFDAYEGRFNLLDVLSLGGQFGLTASNVYDSAGFTAYAEDFVYTDPQTGVVANVHGQIRIDPTTYLDPSTPTHGDIVIVPPRKTAPGASPVNAGPLHETIIASGQTLRITGPTTLSGPVFVRSGGTLLIEDATVDAADHVVAAARGSRLRIADSTIDRPISVATRATDSTIVRSQLGGAVYAALIVVDTPGRELSGNTFLGPTAGLVLWNSAALVQRSLFNASPGVTFWNDTAMPASPTVERSFFIGRGTGLVIAHDAPGAVRNSSFLGRNAIDPYGSSLATEQGHDHVLDARGNWFRDASGPRTYEHWTNGAEIGYRWGEAPPVAYDPWRATMWRAEFTPSALLATNIDPVAFTDSTFDLDGATLTYAWDFGDGSPIESAREPTHVFQAIGDVTVRLDVTDDSGRVSRAEATLRIKAVPVATITGPNETLSLDTVTLDASGATDADGSVVAYRFDFGDGTSTPWQASPATQHAYARPGVYTALATVKDDEGHVSLPAPLVIEVANRAPLASLTAAPDAPTRADTVTFTSTSRDLDGTLVDIAWDFGDGTTAAGPATTHQYASMGTFVATLIVTDDSGATATTTRDITVTNARPIAAFTIAPTFVKPGVPATFTSASLDPDGESVALAWALGDGATSSDPVVEHTYVEEGDFLVTLSATDSDGATTTAERLLLVRYNVPPTPQFHAAAIGDGATWSFKDASVDPDGSVAAWRWEFPDGAVVTTRNATHRFLDAGAHDVALTVTDNKGATATLMRTITVDDVLLVAGTIERGADHATLHIDTRWLNGTGVSAAWSAQVSWQPPGGLVPARQIGVQRGATDADGDASAPLPSPVAGTLAPGRYVVLMRALTSLGVGGNAESAQSVLIFDVPVA